MTLIETVVIFGGTFSALVLFIVAKLIKKAL